MPKRVHPTDIRQLNKWLEANVPFRAKAKRLPHSEVTIFSEMGKDLGPYRKEIAKAFGIQKIQYYGQPNYLSWTEMGTVVPRKRR